MSGTSQRHHLALPAALVVASAVAGFVLGRQSSSAPATVEGVQTATTHSFVGVLASSYPDGAGGCVAADPGQGLDTGTDTHCGRLWTVPGFAPGVDARVRATPLDLRDTGDEAVQGYLLAAPGGP